MPCSLIFCLAKKYKVRDSEEKYYNMFWIIKSSGKSIPTFSIIGQGSSLPRYVNKTKPKNRRPKNKESKNKVVLQSI
ncbi:unnamed protein product [Cuscuta campestris]|uniref:Uncharacterized protein n=1 Tax=Cuscuta campestris TaxID=132261 RepID=A0A484N9K6_9ASTE|nr:unnamed protein product [Cuscuta campestris]